MRAIDDVACSKPGCDNFGQPGVNIVCHGWFTTKSGRRRRYRCKSCQATLSTNTGTAYSALRCSRKAFDQVASLRVEDVSVSATARVTGHSRNTIAHWLERASMAAERFNRQTLRDFPILELQADEIFTSRSRLCHLNDKNSRGNVQNVRADSSDIGDGQDGRRVTKVTTACVTFSERHGPRKSGDHVEQEWLPAASSCATTDCLTLTRE
jgi:hypothetical protein